VCPGNIAGSIPVLLYMIVLGVVQVAPALTDRTCTDNSIRVCLNCGRYRYIAAGSGQARLAWMNPHHASNLQHAFAMTLCHFAHAQYVSVPHHVQVTTSPPGRLSPDYDS
jgi:hypothetical protein